METDMRSQYLPYLEHYYSSLHHPHEEIHLCKNSDLTKNSCVTGTCLSLSQESIITVNEDAVNTINRVYRAICVTVKPDIDIPSAGSLDNIGVLTRGSIHFTKGIDLVLSEMAKSILHGLQLLLLYDTCRSHVISSSQMRVSEIS